VTTPAGVETDLGWALGQVMRAHLRTAQEVVGGLPGGPRGYQVLTAAGRGEPSSQLALAQKLGVDRTVMTYLLDDLETGGLIQRRPDPADRRARRVVLTDAGQARLCDLERRFRAAEEHLLDPLDAGERTVLRGLLQRLATRSDLPGGGSPCQVAEELAAQDRPPRC